MRTFLEIDHVDRIFILPNGNHYIALKNIHLGIKQGEFVTLMGQPGCGKSTLINIVAGLQQPTQGGVILAGRQVRDPGPDRIMIFPNYSLLPWLTVRENIAVGMDEVMPEVSIAERQQIVESYIEKIGLQSVAHQRPEKVPSHVKQRVAIARALSMRPKVLLLDNPFATEDNFRRRELQMKLMSLCAEAGVTCLLVTPDIDEALLLSDRIVLLTNGPEAHIGLILDVNMPRPRDYMAMINDLNYYPLRHEIIYFLNQQQRAKYRKAMTAVFRSSESGLEKENLTIGFIAITDCAPLVVAQEKNFFAEYGLTGVTLQREESWEAIAQGVATGKLDAAQMVAGMPMAMTLGMKGMPPIPTVTGLTLSRNGNAITFNKQFYQQGIRTLEDFKAAIVREPQRRYRLGMVHSASMQNLMLRYWLAGGGIDPDRDVELIVIPPAQMMRQLASGHIDGYCVGDPWNSRAIYEDKGFVIATDIDFWPGHVEKVLGVTEVWANTYPKTHVALVKTLIDACEYCDDRRNREEILELLCQPQYVGSSPIYTRPGFIDPYNRGTGAGPELLFNYNQFYVDKTNCPDPVESLWILTQMARWGIIPFPRNWIDMIERVLRPDVFGEAARDLGLPDVSYERRPLKLFDGTIFNPNHPLEYLENVAIKREVTIEEILLEPF